MEFFYGWRYPPKSERTEIGRRSQENKKTTAVCLLNSIFEADLCLHY